MEQKLWNVMARGLLVSKKGKKEEKSVVKEKLTEAEAEMWRWRFNKQGYGIVAVLRSRNTW